MSDNPEQAPARNYAAAIVEFLDRDSGKVRTAMMYPICSVTLLPLNEPQHPQFGYAVDDAGEWFATDATLPPASPYVPPAADEQPDLFTDEAPHDPN